MGDDTEYNEDKATYGTEKPPYWVRPILELFPKVQMTQCGALNGSWVKLYFDIEESGKNSVELERNQYSISVKGYPEKRLDVGPVSHDNIMERDEKIGERVREHFSAFESFEAGLEAI